MQLSDQQQAAALLADPSTSAETLAQIATAHRELWPQVAQHPNVYPGLTEWMQQQGFALQPVAPVAQSAPAAQQPVWGPPVAESTPRKKRTGLIVGIVTGLAVVAAAAIALPMLLGGSNGGSGSSRDILARFESADDFELMVVDLEKLGAAIGEPLPSNGSQREIEEWFDTVHEYDDLIEYHAIPYSYDDHVPLLAAGSGYVQAFLADGMRMTSTVLTSLAPISDETLDGLFGQADNGIWSSDLLTAANFDGVTFLSYHVEGPSQRLPDPGESLAAHQPAVRVLARLEQTDGYLYRVSSGQPLTSLQENLAKVDGRAGHVEAAGLALSLRNGDEPRVTYVWDFGTAEDANDNLERVMTALERTADYVDNAEADSVYVEGSLVIAELSLRDNYLQDYWDLFGLVGA